jgi:hypothetical protein
VNGPSLKTSRWWRYFNVSRGLGSTVMVTGAKVNETAVPP